MLIVAYYIHDRYLVQCADKHIKSTLSRQVDPPQAFAKLYRGMPPPNAYPIQELLMRLGVGPDIARTISLNELRYWNMADLERLFAKVKLNPKTFSTFMNPDGFLQAWRQPQEIHDRIRSIMPGLCASDSPWLSAPRSPITQAADEEAALCIMLTNNGRSAVRVFLPYLMRGLKACSRTGKGKLLSREARSI